MNDKTDQVVAAEESSEKKRLWWLWALVAVAIIVGGYRLASHGTEAKKAQELKRPPTPTPVVAVAVKKADIGVYLTGLGSVTPLNTVTVKSRVDGQLMEVLFREGENVRKGQLLARIDSRPFDVLLTQAEGQMTRDRELLNNARLDLQRYKQLWQQDSIPRQQLDTQEALVRQYEGAVKVDQGQIDNAKLQQVYSRIIAPISGRVGLRQIDPGNIIHAADAGGLVTITQLQPMAVIFPIPEDNLPKLTSRMKMGGKPAVAAFDREQKQKLADGFLLTLDNQIDPATGTLKLKAVFPNIHNELFPNQFVNARILLETRHDALTIPAAAVQRGAQGTFVYLVKPDLTVAVRPVTLGPGQGDLASVTGGLAEGEQVVVDGAERLREGSTVELREPGKRGGKESAPPAGTGQRAGAAANDKASGPEGVPKGDDRRLQGDGQGQKP
jgi:membrane fusion protein, multidrug efflux system